MDLSTESEVPATPGSGHQPTTQAQEAPLQPPSAPQQGQKRCTEEHGTEDAAVISNRPPKIARTESSAATVKDAAPALLPNAPEINDDNTDEGRSECSDVKMAAETVSTAAAAAATEDSSMSAVSFSSPLKDPALPTSAAAASPAVGGLTSPDWGKLEPIMEIPGWESPPLATVSISSKSVSPIRKLSLSDERNDCDPSSQDK